MLTRIFRLSLLCIQNESTALVESHLSQIHALSIDTAQKVWYLISLTR